MMIVAPIPVMPNRKFRIGRWVNLSLLLAAVCLASGTRLCAQEALKSAQVVGVVHDSAGRVVAGVTVQLRGQGRSDSLEASTNSDGRFVFPALNAGGYTVTLRKPGFRDANDSITLAA